MDLQDYEYKHSQFNTLSDNEKKITLGKLKQLETLVDLLNTMRESLTRELYVNGCETDEDVLETKQPSDDLLEQGLVV